MRLAFYICDKGYIAYLTTFDNRVPQVDKGPLLRQRPLIGVVLEIEGNKFYAPVSSPKAKHLKMKNSKDFIKIDSGTYGVINLNNMVPVLDKYVQEIDIVNYPIMSKDDLNYVNLLSNQLTWCNSHKQDITERAKALYHTIINGLGNEGLTSRCCNFKLLVEKSKEYNK